MILLCKMERSESRQLSYNSSCALVAKPEYIDILLLIIIISRPLHLLIDHLICEECDNNELFGL